jgi:CRISPR-associated exonuclease Cas4
MDEDNLLPISGLQHLAFCRRQCALIHIESVWEENRLTAEGRLIHERAHDAETELLDGILIARGLRLVNRRLGLIGVADVVEFHPDGNGVVLPGHRGEWRPFPVEYKRGKPKTHNADRIQLCAQALCLEEMLGVNIGEGALFYAQPHRREKVVFDDSLRQEVKYRAREFHALIRDAVVPVAEYDSRCRQCSLLDICQPQGEGSAAAYLRTELDSIRESADEKA